MRKNAFEKKYSLFIKYIDDDQTRKNMLDNKELYRKYQENNELIKIFIYELDKRFTINQTFKIIKETIFKYPDEILKSFIIAYLNSSENVKSKEDVYNDFKKIIFMGEDIIKYVSRNGIIIDRSYKNIPEKILDEKYEELKSGIEIFHTELLDNVFKLLNYDQKQIIVKLLEIDSFTIFSKCFENNENGLISVLNLLLNIDISMEIFNKNNLEYLSIQDIINVLVSALENKNFTTNINILLKNNRILFIKRLIEEDELESLNEISKEEISSIVFDDKYLKNLDIKAYIASLRQSTLRKLKEVA